MGSIYLLEIRNDTVYKFYLFGGTILGSVLKNNFYRLISEIELFFNWSLRKWDNLMPHYFFWVDSLKKHFFFRICCFDLMFKEVFFSRMYFFAEKKRLFQFFDRFQVPRGSENSHVHAWKLVCNFF